MSENWENLLERINYYLRLKHIPIAVKLLRNIEDVPKEARILKSTYTFCQFNAFSRLYERIVVTTKDNLMCPWARYGFGFDILPATYRIVIARTDEDINKFFDNLPRIQQGKIQAIVQSPLNKYDRLFDSPPSLVLVTVNPAQMMRLLNSFVWLNGERVESRNAAHCGICNEAVVAPYLSNKVHVAFPCYGGRTFGQYADDELILAIPGNLFNDHLITALKNTHDFFPYPIRQRVVSQETFMF